MNKTIYFFEKVVDDKIILILGTDKERSRVSAGSVKTKPTIDSTDKIEIYIDDVPLRTGALVTEILKEDDQPYESFAELNAATTNFFVKAPGSVAGGGLTKYALPGVDGDIVDGERIGDVKSFTLPTAIKEPKQPIAIVGGLPDFDFTIATVDGARIITFTNAPLAGSFLLY